MEIRISFPYANQDCLAIGFEGTDLNSGSNLLISLVMSLVLYAPSCKTEKYQRSQRFLQAGVLALIIARRGYFDRDNSGQTEQFLEAFISIQGARTNHGSVITKYNLLFLLFFIAKWALRLGYCLFL